MDSNGALARRVEAVRRAIRPSTGLVLILGAQGSGASSMQSELKLRLAGRMVALMTLDARPVDKGKIATLEAQLHSGRSDGRIVVARGCPSKDARRRLTLAAGREGLHTVVACLRVPEDTALRRVHPRDASEVAAIREAWRQVAAVTDRQLQREGFSTVVMLEADAWALPHPDSTVNLER